MRGLTGQRRDAVHEDPEAGEGEGRLKDTVEGQAHGEHEGGDIAGCFCVGESSDHHVCECRCEDEELDEEKQDEALALGGRDAAAGVDRVEV